jgi:hypothetical protein
MKIAKLNKLFTSKALVKNPKKISPKAFWENYEQGALLGDTVRPVRATSIAPSAPSAQSGDLTNGPIDPLKTALGSSLDIVELNYNPPLDLSAFTVAYNMNPGLEPWGGTQEDVIVTGGDISIDLPSLLDTPIIDLRFRLELPTVEDPGCVYNFYVKQYEEETGTPDFDEKAMLDSYGIILNMESRIPGNTDPEQQINPDVFRYDGANNRLSFNLQLSPNTSFETIKNFYRNFAVNAAEFGTGPAENWKNVIYPAGSIASVNSATSTLIDTVPSEHGGGFVPYYIGLTMYKAKSDGPVVKAFEESGMANNLMGKFLATMDNSMSYDLTNFSPAQEGFGPSYPARVWDLATLLDGGLDPTAVFGLPSVVMGTVADRLSTFPELEPSFGTNTDELQLLLGIYSAIADNYRDWSDLNQNAAAYSEVVFYRLAKHKDNDQQNPIQNFFFFNDSSSELIKFMDTQVKVDDEYHYKLYSYSVVLGNEYVEDRALESEQDALVVINNAQRIKLVEVNAYSTTTFVSSKPPLFPEVSFRSFIGDDRRIRITMDQQMGARYEQPIVFNDDERQRANKLRWAQSSAGPLHYKNDDVSKVYEIFRTVNPPTSPMSFQNSLWRRVTDSSVLENVTADQTYYYMFRVIDAHGNISNPSPAFEVTLVGGFSPYLLVEQYDYDAKKPKNKTKSRDMRRFLRMRPSLSHLVMKNEFEGMNSSEDAHSVRLGVSTDGGLWGEKFKVRITSMETGKKIDYNIEYDYNFEPRE